jgi:enoyl-CoA hydratase
MSFTTLQLTVNKYIAHLQFIRPESYNSLNRSFWNEFPRALKQVDADDVRVLVISSTGKHFSAGMDLEIFSNPDPRMFSGDASRRAEYIRRLVLDLQEIFTQLEKLRMPVLVAIQGGCIGGALDMVCACDSRFCTQDAFFTVKETALGMTADLGTLQRLPGLINPGLARELVYTARKLEADEAKSSGLVNAVYEDNEALMTGVMDIAQQIASHSPLAINGSKVMLNYARDHGLADSLDYMATWQSGMFHPVDMMESFTAKQQQRETHFEPLRPIEPPFPEDKSE